MSFFECSQELVRFFWGKACATDAPKPTEDAVPLSGPMLCVSWATVLCCGTDVLKMVGRSLSLQSGHDAGSLASS